MRVEFLSRRNTHDGTVSEFHRPLLHSSLGVTVETEGFPPETSVERGVFLMGDLFLRSARARFSLASQSKTVTKGEDARRENPKGNKEIWESREMS